MTTTTQIQLGYRQWQMYGECITLLLDGDDTAARINDDHYEQPEEAEATARRLAAAWNACEGIPTEALEAGALRELASITSELLAEVRQYRADVGPCEHDADICACALDRLIDASTAALAKLQGAPAA